MVVFEVENVPLLSDYLHDSILYLDDVSYDKLTSSLSLILNRICYEKSKKRRCFFIFSVIQSPSIRLEVKINNVAKIEYRWKENAFADDNKYMHTLLDICLVANKLTIETDVLCIDVGLSSFCPIELTDTSEPSKKYRDITFGKRPIFTAMGSIKKFKNV